MPDPLKVCYDRILPSDLRMLTHTHPGDRPRLAVFREKKWTNAATLKVRFMGGDAQKQALVRQFAPQWCKCANLKFEFGNAPDAEIRIAFNSDDGAWSYIGIDCLGIPRDQPTMNLGWVDEGVILHEFGHAIGLIHEHQNPLGGIKWNRDAVIRSLSGAPNFWDLPTIENNMFKTYDRNQINGTQLDGKSIMLYSIPREWTTDGFFSEPNEVLSEVDKTFIGDPKNYPFSQPSGGGVVELPVIETAATQGDIARAGETDLYKFNAVKSGVYTIETEGSTDVVMKLFGPDSQTNLVAEDDDSGAGSNAKIVATLSPGAYYAQVRHYNSTNGTGAYSIKVTKQ
ncbi:MAG: pre-peptidase C-terminal domain-containing protein [Burkholderiales bacterium]|nr:pre-peptidase C-terminal domain-containing protein [Phycisphaerae bacterium]